MNNNELLIAKHQACGFDMKSLNLIFNTCPIESKS